MDFGGSDHMGTTMADPEAVEADRESKRTAAVDDYAAVRAGMERLRAERECPAVEATGCRCLWWGPNRTLGRANVGECPVHDARIDETEERAA